MYEPFFGLRERPFQLTPNPRFLFLNAGHREALATLRYGLTSSLGITLLLGEAGTGKTTLLHAALHAEHRPLQRYAVLSNPRLSPADFFEILAATFSLLHTSGSKGRFLLAFERELRERHREGGQTALVIDEAQSLTDDLFEEIRLLANLETETAKLVNVVLVGQPELADRLNDPSLRQLKQRVSLRCSLAPLDLESTASYIALRLRVAGASPGDVFTRGAVGTIYEASRGIPRTIGVICENALLAGYAAQRRPIDRGIVDDVCRDFDIPVNGNGQPSASPALASDASSGTAAPEDAAESGPSAPPQPEPGQRTWRVRFSSPRTESPPEPAAVRSKEASEGSSAPPVVPHRTRRSRFF
jgi:general secretion pathway protein A